MYVHYVYFENSTLFNLDYYYIVLVVTHLLRVVQYKDLASYLYVIMYL